MPNLTKLYIVAAVLPFSVAIVIGGALDLYEGDYWSIDNIGLEPEHVMLYSLIVAVLSLTIFFNKIPLIANYRLSSMLFWMLIPCGIIIYTTLSETLSWNSYPSFFDESTIEIFLKNQRFMKIYLVIVSVIHILSLIYSYIIFRRKYKRSSLNKGD